MWTFLEVMVAMARRQFGEENSHLGSAMDAVVGVDGIVCLRGVVSTEETDRLRRRLGELGFIRDCERCSDTTGTVFFVHRTYGSLPSLVRRYVPFHNRNS
jgi:hypothetical protein